MSFVMNENAGGGASRRRVSQASNDEWRAALQQQIDEKKQRDEQLKRFRHYEDASDFASAPTSHAHARTGFDDANDTRSNYDTDAHAWVAPGASLRPGRRGVQHMSNEAWREALEQQIREKKEREAQQQCRGGDAARRRSQSAPGQAPLEDESRFSEMKQQQERATTTPCASSNSDSERETVGTHAAVGRRCTSVQTQEEHAKRLQEQLEVQKVQRSLAHLCSAH